MFCEIISMASGRNVDAEILFFYVCLQYKHDEFRVCVRFPCRKRDDVKAVEGSYCGMAVSKIGSYSIQHFSFRQS